MTRGLAASKPGCKGAGNSRIDERLSFWRPWKSVVTRAEFQESKRGVSALLLQRQLGLSSYETAWMMLHKLNKSLPETILACAVQ